MTVEYPCIFLYLYFYIYIYKIINISFLLLGIVITFKQHFYEYLLLLT